MSDQHEIPVHEVYRGCEVWALQSPERIATARQQIDAVIATSDLGALYEFACDAGNSPEARELAGNKLYVAREKHRASSQVDWDRLGASLVGVTRITPRLGRIMAARLALAAHNPWPEAWMTWRRGAE